MKGRLGDKMEAYQREALNDNAPSLAALPDSERMAARYDVVDLKRVRASGEVLPC